MDSEQTNQLLAEIRDLLRANNNKYAEYLVMLDKKNADWHAGMTDKIRYWSFMFWAGTFIAMGAAAYVGASMAR